MNMDNMKLKIFKVEIAEENQIIPIDFKLPNNISRCIGIYISVKEYLAIDKEEISPLGELSLMFNAKAVHPLHITAEYTKDLLHKKDFLELDCKIEANTNITGFYSDYGNTKEGEKRFLPYTLQIYMMCESINKDIIK